MPNRPIREINNIKSKKSSKLISVKKKKDESVELEVSTFLIKQIAKLKGVKVKDLKKKDVEKFIFDALEKREKKNLEEKTGLILPDKPNIITP